jgi:hypothetical protein
MGILDLPSVPNYSNCTTTVLLLLLYYYYYYYYYCTTVIILPLRHVAARHFADPVTPSRPSRGSTTGGDATGRFTRGPWIQARASESKSLDGHSIHANQLIHD